MSGFELHPQLAADSWPVGELPLCRLLLMRDARYPWCLLVPRRAEVSEIFQLSWADQHQLLEESTALARVMADAFRADKLNIAALGNVVPQLHLHHIVRFRSDPAWPAPVWGRMPPLDYEPAERERRIEALRAGLRDLLGS